LTSLDNAGDAARAAANATQLAAANSVNAIFGHAFSATCASATTVAERYKVPTACLSVAEPNKYIYNLGPANARAAGPMLAAAKTLAGTQSPKVAVVYVNTLTSTKLGKNIEAAAPAAGVTVVTAQEIDSASADPSVQVARIVEADPQVILITHTGPGFVTVMRGVRAAGLTAPVVWADGTNLGFVSDFTDDAAYALTVYQLVEPDASESVAVEYVDAITPTLSEVTGAALNSGDTVLGYMSARAFGEALEQCGYPCSGEQLQGVLDGLKVPLDGLEADYQFTADDHYPFPNWYLYQFTGQETTLVEGYARD
jgi:ABC-type branched-subunit amino acid transport system substrate-binding protein